MARDLSGTTQGLRNNSNLLGSTPAEPFTFACWFNADASSNVTLMSYSQSNTANDFCNIDTRADGTLMVYQNVQAEGLAFSSTTYGTGAWHHACGVFASSTSRSIYLDGGGKNTNTTNTGSWASGTYNVGVGYLQNGGSQISFFNGKIAEAAIWNAALTDAEVATLAAGYSPMLVRPQNIIGYWPIIGKNSPEVPRAGEAALTLVGAPAAYPHPGIYYPAPLTVRYPGSPAAANTVRSFGIILPWGKKPTAATPTPPASTIADSDKPGSTTDNVVLSLGSGGTWDDDYITAPCTVLKDGTVYLFYGGYDGSNERSGVATAPGSKFQLGTFPSFTKSGSNPILDLGSGGSWDDDAATGPYVIYDEDESTWKMWYTGGDGGSPINNSIGYATASDPEGPWTKYGSNPVLSPSESWEGTKVGIGCVLKEGVGDYKMMYTGDDVVAGSEIGLATSSDGITWTKSASNPVLSTSGTGWMQKSVLTPSTLLKVNGTYYLYFAGKPTSTPDYSKIGLATSTDLVNWTLDADNPLLVATRAWEGTTSPPGEVEFPHLLSINNLWYMFYFCWYGSPKTIGVAVLQQ